MSMLFSCSRAALLLSSISFCSFCRYIGASFLRGRIRSSTFLPARSDILTSIGLPSRRQALPSGSLTAFSTSVAPTLLCWWQPYAWHLRHGVHLQYRCRRYVLPNHVRSRRETGLRSVPLPCGFDDKCQQQLCYPYRLADPHARLWPGRLPLQRLPSRRPADELHHPRRQHLYSEYSISTNAAALNIGRLFCVICRRKDRIARFPQEYRNKR